MAFLEGRSAIVTGAAGGIGSAIAARLAGAQASVVGVDHQFTADGESPDRSIRQVQADVADMAAIERATAIAIEAGPLAVCVANAGVLLIEDLLDGSVDRWERVLRVNVLGVMNTFQAAARAMVAAGSDGCLIATASVAGLRGEAGSPAYSASKAAVVNLVQSLALELAPHGITVNAVAPGEVDTAMHKEAMERLGVAQGLSAGELRKRVIEQIPLRQMASPDDVAGVVAFLASPEAAYLTGVTVRVDGGQLLV
jgi:NAD(P)-dependent dehydrogenase (short-subunit alcohol dehydrogenase family)